MKKNYQTSEFWFTLVSFIISGLFLGGVITEADTKNDLIDAVTHGVESVILIGGQFFVLSKYLKKRKEEKLASEKTKQIELDSGHSNRININTASVEELEVISGIGPSIAQKIVAHREEHGYFSHIAEIMDVKGVGVSIYREIDSKIKI